MKKRFLILMMVICLLAGSGVYAENAAHDVPEFDIPVNEPAGDFMSEGGKGTVLFADGAAVFPSETETAVEGYVPETLDKTIIEPDNRIQVSKPGEYPYSAIAYMEVTAECGDSWTGSGFMVGKNCLMTAAHCMVCHEHGKWADRITLYFGYRSSGNYLYKYNDRWFARAGTQFPRHTYDYDAMQEDWAYVILSSDVGNVTGWLGFKFATDYEVSSRNYIVAGYRYGKLKYCWGSAYAEDNKIIGHWADTVPGNSGGPVFTSDNYADAINVAENEKRQINWGRRITSDIWSYMKQDGYR